MELFKPATDVAARAARRQTLRIADNVTVISYLGSFGTWYMAEEMLDFIKVLKDQRPVVFLIISRDDPNQILASAQARGLKTDDVRIVAATREEVPPLLSLSDYTLFFIRPTFSKKASSPTKMGEALSMGIPVICNDGIGDCTEILMEGKAGIIVETFTDVAFKNTADILIDMPEFDKAVIRAVASARLDLKKGVEKYHNIYAMIGSKTEGVCV
jgi:glycosyltransferase involved in cell wall biosynthesis